MISDICLVLIVLIFLIMPLITMKHQQYADSHGG